MEQLNNREISILAWGIFFLIFIIFYSIKNQALRESLKQLLLAFLNIKIIFPIVIMILYVIGIVTILFFLGIWDDSQLKNTLFWFFIFCFSSLFRLKEIKEKSSFFYKKIIKDSLKLVAILQFIINFHSYNLILELLIIPLITLLTILSYLANNDKKTQNLKKVIDCILSILFFIFLINFIFSTIQDYSSFFNTKSFQDFFTPILLTLLYFPFLWSFVLWTTYEENFIRLPRLIKNKKIINLAKIYLIFFFTYNKDHIEEWLSHIKIHEISNHQELLNSISLIKRRNKLEKNPSIIPIENGWSPYQAKDFLSSYDLQPIHYKNIGDNIWFCSKIIGINDQLDSPTISYFIQGNENCVTQLKLKLFLYQIENIDFSLKLYLNILDELLRKSLDIALSEDNRELIIDRKSFQTEIKNKKLVFHYEEFNYISPSKCEFFISLKNP